jgi:hypothetical protein
MSQLDGHGGAVHIILTIVAAIVIIRVHVGSFQWRWL